MGTTSSKKYLDELELGVDVQNHEGIVLPELLLSELNHGQTQHDDFIAKSLIALKTNPIPMDQLQLFPSTHALSFDDLGELLQPGYLPMENGYSRRNDGVWCVAILTDLGSAVDGDLFDWWFCHCEEDEHHKWWHPVNHLKGTWDPSYYAAMPFERKLGHYIDHFELVDEKINDKFYSFQYEYIRPSRYFDQESFEENGIKGCVMARIYMKDSSLGMVAIGYILHLVRETGHNKHEVRTRIWLGEIAYPETPENFYYAQIINYLANTSIIRMMKNPESFARDMWTTWSEKMHCLKHFLPDYYRVAVVDHQKYRDFSFN